MQLQIKQGNQKGKWKDIDDKTGRRGTERHSGWGATEDKIVKENWESNKYRWLEDNVKAVQYPKLLQRHTLKSYSNIPTVIKALSLHMILCMHHPKVYTNIFLL